MEKHQEDHAAAMERLYSPQRSMDIIMSSAPCSFLHCLIVEVLPLLTSKHFFTQPLAQLFGFWSSCLSLLACRRDDYQKEIRLLTEKHAKEIQGLKEDRCTTEQASHWWWGIEARLCSIVRSPLPLIPRHVLHLGLSLWTFNLSLSPSLYRRFLPKFLCLVFFIFLWWDFTPSACGDDLPRFVLAYDILWYTLFHVTSLFPLSMNWKFKVQFSRFVSAWSCGILQEMKHALETRGREGVAEVHRLQDEIRSVALCWDNCDWTCESQRIGQFFICCRC